MLVQRRKTIQAMAGMAGMVAGALVMVPGASQAMPSVPLSLSGSIEVWGATSATISGQPVRVTYDNATGGPWAATTLSNDGNDFGITGTGILKRLSGTDTVVDIPAALTSAKVKAVSSNALKVAVVKADGSVQIWGDTLNVQAQTLTEAQLGAKAVDVQVNSGALLISILLDDGRVVVVRSDGFEHIESEPGVDLTGVVETVTTPANYVLARLSGGGVFAYSSNGDPTGVPAAISGDHPADPVVTVAGTDTAVAATASGAVYTWDYSTGDLLADATKIYPSSEAQGKVVDVAASNRYFAALTDDEEMIVWGQSTTARDYTKMRAVPAEVTGQEVVDLIGSQFTFAAVVSGPIVPLAVTAVPTIAGSAKVNSTLTGTPATFDGTPDAITHKWFADGAAISGATDTTYKLTAAELGKNITFESTATRVRGNTSLASISTAAGPVGAEDVALPSKTVVTAPSKAYGSTGTATVTVSNTAGRPVAGNITLTGAGAAQTKALVSGKATFALAKNLAPKAYTLSAKYSGSAQLIASTGAVRYTVAKGKVRSVSYKTTKTPTKKKTGKATVTVTAPSGLAKATGKVAVTLKKGSSKKVIKANLSGGKRSITLPKKLKKGTYKVTIFYYGNKNYGSAKSKTYKLKIKK